MSSRLTTTLMQSGASFGAGRQAPIVDVGVGGTGNFGYAPDLTQWVSNAAHIKHNVICVLIEAPKGFQTMPDGAKWVGTLRELVESSAQTIEGLAAGLEVQVAETPVGGAGEMQEDVTNVTRARTQVTFKWPEKYGRAIGFFFEAWITNLIMDPQTKYPNAATMSQAPADLLPDYFAATMLFIEPDPTGRKVVQAWLGTNMFPKSNGENTARKDQTAEMESVTHDIQFTGVYQYGRGVDTFAQQILDSMALTGANPENRNAFISAIDPNVSAARAGYANSIQTVANGSLRV